VGGDGWERGSRNKRRGKNDERANHFKETKKEKSKYLKNREKFEATQVRGTSKGKDEQVKAKKLCIWGPPLLPKTVRGREGWNLEGDLGSERHFWGGSTIEGEVPAMPKLLWERIEAKGILALQTVICQLTTRKAKKEDNDH